jgi:hypothetical protein
MDLGIGGERLLLPKLGQGLESRGHAASKAAPNAIETGR